MSGGTIIGGSFDKEKEKLQRSELSKWERRKKNRTTGAAYLAIPCAFSLYFSLIEGNTSWIVTISTFGVFFIPFLIAVVLLNRAKNKIKQLEESY